jgi:hypothetical protein
VAKPSVVVLYNLVVVVATLLRLLLTGLVVVQLPQKTLNFW